MFTMQRQEQAHSFAANEWALLMQAPMQAVAAVALADKTDPLNLLRTAQATVQILSEEQVRQKPWNQLIGSLMDSMNAADVKLAVKGKELLMRKQFIVLGQLQTLNNTSDGHNIAIETCKQMALILSVKASPLEMEEFINWLLMITIRILKTAKKSSFFEITNPQINEKERLALQRLNALFNVNDELN